MSGRDKPTMEKKSISDTPGGARPASVHDGTVDVVDDQAVREFYGESVDEAYRLKSELVTKHLSDIGMGRFQWSLFVINGFGWVVDNFWSQGITAARPAVANEYTDISSLSFSSVAYYVGLILGATFWSISADLIGRKPAFNATILLGGIFACAVAGAQSFTAFCALWACIGTAAGGNVPVDSIMFLEFIPPTHQWLLVTLSGWWNFGQLVVSLLAWVFLANYACDSSNAPCAMRENMGWRYMMLTLGAMALALGLIRIFTFKIPESPRYLLSKGRDADAVDAVNYIARYNGRPETLTLDMFEAIDARCAPTEHEHVPRTQSRPSHLELIRQSFQDYGLANVRRLFAGRKMARHTSISLLIWLMIGVAYPLYFAFITSYLQASSAAVAADTSLGYTYKVYCIVSACGVIGPISAGFAVETRLGRRWMMGISAILTGVFLFAYTAVRTEASDIGFQVATGILGNFEYAIMFAFTPESFPGPVRGTGTGIAAALLRFGGLIASIASIYAGYTSTPVYASAAIWVVAGLVCFGLPYETHGHGSI